MQKPDKDLEAEFNKGGIFFLAQRKMQEIAEKDASYVGVKVEIDVLKSAPVSVPDFSFSVKNKRGVACLFTDWAVKEVDDERKTLTFDVWVRCSPEAAQMLNDSAPITPLAMSFLDFCFYAGNEAIPESYGEDVFTKIHDGAIKADLGWLLPVRLVDPLIDSLGKMNDAVLAGMLQEGILYGPMVR